MAVFRAMPYAKALHQVVGTSDPKRADATVAELDAMATVVEEVPEFNRALTTPTVPPETKIEVLKAVIKALKLSTEVARLMHVVQQHYRMQHMRDIADTYRGLVDRALGRARATIETAAEIDDSQQTKIRSVLTDVIGSEIIASFHVNPELLAGFRFQVGSRVFDGSLNGQLDRLRSQSQIE